MPDAEAALRTAARLRLLSYAFRERLGQREPTVIRVLAAAPPERVRLFDTLAVKIATNAWGPLGGEWAAATLETVPGRRWANDLLLELLAAPVPAALLTGGDAA